MAEVSSSKAVQSSENKVEKPVEKPADNAVHVAEAPVAPKTNNSVDIFSLKTAPKKEAVHENPDINIDFVAIGKDKKAVLSPTELQVETNTDIYKSIVDKENAKAESQAVIEQKAWQQTLMQKSIEVSETIQKNIPKLPEPPSINIKETESYNLFTKLTAKITDPFAKLQENINRKKQEFVDIFDKLAAIYGEKEKDLKDRLSDTFKRIFPKKYEALGEIDTAMEHSDHHSQKKLKDRTSQGKNQNDEQEELKLRQKINYKLLEIKGEILNLTNRIRAKLSFKGKIKKKLHGEFKKVKQDIVGTLDRVESLIDPDEEKNK